MLILFPLLIVALSVTSAYSQTSTYYAPKFISGGTRIDDFAGNSIKGFAIGAGADVGLRVKKHVETGVFLTYTYKQYTEDESFLSLPNLQIGPYFNFIFLSPKRAVRPYLGLGFFVGGYSAGYYQSKVFLGNVGVPVSGTSRELFRSFNFGQYYSAGASIKLRNEKSLIVEIRHEYGSCRNIQNNLFLTNQSTLITVALQCKFKKH